VALRLTSQLAVKNEFWRATAHIEISITSSYTFLVTGNVFTHEYCLLYYIGLV